MNQPWIEGLRRKPRYEIEESLSGWRWRFAASLALNVLFAVIIAVQAVRIAALD